jgi:hypothetical protein
MSWSIRSIGPRAAVKAAVLSPGNAMPESLKTSIIEILDGAGVTKNSALIEGNGHGPGDDWSNISSLKVELFNVAELPVPKG